MLVLHFLTAWAGKAANHLSETQFSEKLSLMHPHVSDNGRNDFYAYGGQYVVRTRAPTSYSQICYTSPNSSGFVQMKEPVRQRNFKAEIEFSLKPQQGGVGYGFWLGSKISPGTHYGRNGDFTGMGVIISTRTRPSVKFVDTNQSVKEKVLYPNFGDAYNRLVFENANNKLLVRLFVGKNEYVVYDGPSTLSPEYVLGISGATGDTNAALRISSIVGYTIKRIRVDYVRGEAKKSSWLVVLVALCCVGGLVYYLFTKQQKDFAMKK